MAYVLQKGAKFMTGHGYCSLRGYKFSWSFSSDEARRFADDDPSVDVFSARTGARIVAVPNTSKEQQELGRRAMQYSTKETK